MIPISSSIVYCCSCHAGCSYLAALSGSFAIRTYSGSRSSWNSSFCSCSLLLIHSCTNVSRLFCHTPWCCLHTLLFLVVLLTWVTIYFLDSFVLISSLFRLLFLFQLFSQGLCQLHSISAYLGRIYYLQKSSLTFLICRIKSLICSSIMSYLSLGSVISLRWNSSEYSTTLWSSSPLLHHWNSFSVLI